MIESEDDSTVDLTTPGRKPRKSIRKSTAIDLIKEEPEEETASEFNDSKEMNQTVIDELELRTRSISKSPSTSLSPQKTSVIEKSSQNSAINFSALEDDEEEKVEKPGKFFKNRSQFSKNQTSDDKKMSFNDGSDEIEKFVSNGNSRSSEKTTFEGVIERMQDNVVERDVRDALLSPSKLFRGRRSIHGEKSDDEVDKMLEDFVADDDILQAGGKTPKSARKILKNIEETPLSVGKLSELIATPKSIAKTPKSSEKVLKMSETPKSVKKISENATEAVQSSPLITGTPKSASKTPKLSESLKSAEKVMEMLKTPKSASKVSRSVDTTPKAAENSPAAIKTPKSVKKTPESDVSIPETPMSASKVIGTPNGTPKSDKFSVTPKSAQKSDKISQNTPKSAVKTTLDTIKTPKGKDTPKSAKKTDSPKNHNETSLNNDKMDITAKSSDMEISPSSPSKNKISRISPVKTDHKSVNIETMQRRTWSQSVSNGKQDSPVHRHSFSEYLENISKSSEKRKSMPKEPVEVISTERSWTHSVRKSREGAIDAAQVDTAPEVIKASPRKSKPISSDESDDDHEKNKFVDDEAEVGSEGESITESERNYLKEHEIPEQGELIGSEDSDEIDDEEEDDDESDSFIDNEVLSDSYDMDSEEERIESSQEKRKSRIIAPSSSEDEEQVEEQLKGSAKKNHKKAEAKHQEIQEADENVENQVESEKEEIAEELPKSKKRKRDSIINESIIETKKKRAKLNSSANGSEAMHMEDLSEKMEVSEPEPRKEKLKKVKKDLFEPKNIVSVIEKCDAFMSAHQKEKKQKMSLKREKRAQKLAKKLEEKRAENMDSSNGENKENAPKKKKKKAKKQKLVEGELSKRIVREITTFFHT